MQYNSQYIDGAYLDQILLEKYFNNKTNGFFIECGANDGITDSNCKLFEDNFNWIGINLEPAPLLFEKLKDNRKKSINLNKALSDTNDIRKFYYPVECYNCGSLDAPSKFVTEELKVTDDKIEEYLVESITYCDLIIKYYIKEVDLFSLDVEGHEIVVLSNMIKCNILPNIICVEYGHCGFDNINAILSKVNYKLDYKDSINCVFQL